MKMQLVPFDASAYLDGAAVFDREGERVGSIFAINALIAAGRTDLLRMGCAEHRKKVVELYVDGTLQEAHAVDACYTVCLVLL